MAKPKSLSFFFLNKQCNLIFLLFVGFFHITRGFKFLSNFHTEIFTIVLLSVIFFNSHLFKITGNIIKKNSFLFFYIFSCFLTAFALALIGVLKFDRYSIQAAYSFSLPLFYIYVLFANLQNIKNYDSYIKYFSYFTFLLSLLNIILFVQVIFFNFSPLFSLNYGSLQPRIYEHYLTGVLAEPGRYISYFGEPSDFVWIMASGFFILLKFRLFLMALISLFSILISGSGSVFIFIFVFVIWALIRKQFTALIIFVFFFAFSFLLIYLFSELTILKMLARFIDPTTHEFHIARFDFLKSRIIDSISSVNYRDQEPLINKQGNLDVLNYTNNFFYSISRLGFFSVLIISSSFLLYCKSIKKLIISQNYEFLFSLICFLLLLFVREAFNFILIFWFIFTLISRNNEISK